jgi:hypothetical protein
MSKLKKAGEVRETRGPKENGYPSVTPFIITLCFGRWFKGQRGACVYTSSGVRPFDRSAPEARDFSLELGKWQSCHASAQRKVNIARVNNISRQGLLPHILPELHDQGCHRRPRRRRRFHFYGDKFPLEFDDEINFRARRCSPEIDSRFRSAMREGSHNFRENGRFHYPSAHGARAPPPDRWLREPRATP